MDGTATKTRTMYLVRRDLPAEGSAPGITQYIASAGRRTMAWGRVVKRHSYNPTLTRDRAEACRFTSRASAKAQVDRYFRWIARQFTVEIDRP